MLAARFFICHEYLCEPKTSHFTMIAPSNISINQKPPSKSNLYFPTTKLTLNCKYFRKAGFVSVISCWAVSLVSILSLSDIFSLISLTTSPVLAPDPPHPFSLYLMSGEVLALSLFLCLLFFLASSFVYLRLYFNVQSSSLLTSRSRSAENISSIYSLFSPYIVLIVSMSLRAARVCLLKSINSGTQSGWAEDVRCYLKQAGWQKVWWVHSRLKLFTSSVTAFSQGKLTW